MKKILSVLMMLILLVSMAGCIQIVKPEDADDEKEISIEAEEKEEAEKAEKKAEEEAEEEAKEKAAAEEEAEEKAAEEKAAEEKAAEEKAAEEKAAEEAEEKAKEEKAKEDALNMGTIELGDSWDDFQFQINDVVYELPMSYEKMIAHGWVYDSDDTIMLNSYSKIFTENFEKDNFLFYGYIANFGINSAPLNKCHIVSVSIDDYYMKDSSTTVLLPGGIELSKSTEEEVIEAYGNPTDRYDGDITHKLTYTLDYYEEVQISIDVETNLVEGFMIENTVEPEDLEEQVVSEEVPVEVTMYEAPTALSDEMFDYVIEYDGDLYKLPAPISAFEANGWTVHRDNVDEILEGNSYGGFVKLTRDNRHISVQTYNYSVDATAVNNWFVTDISGTRDSDDYPITIFYGITRGMTEDEVKAKLEGYDYNYEKSTNITYYEIEDLNSATEGYSILVDTETSKVYGIKVSYGPRRSELFD